MLPCFSKQTLIARITGGDPAGGIRAGVGTAWPHSVGRPAAACGVGVAGWAGAAAGGGVAGGCVGAGAGAGAAGTTDRSCGAGAGSGVGLAGLVRAGIVGPGMFDGAGG